MTKKPDRLSITTKRCEPEWFDGLPCCSESCPSHDGKRCELMGFRPSRLCEPAVAEIFARSAESISPRTMSKEDRRRVAATVVDSLIGGGLIQESGSLRAEAVRTVSGKLAEIERCGMPTGSYPQARVSLADHIDDTYSSRQDGD